MSTVSSPENESPIGAFVPKTDAQREAGRRAYIAWMQADEALQEMHENRTVSTEDVMAAMAATAAAHSIKINLIGTDHPHGLDFDNITQ